MLSLGVKIAQSALTLAQLNKDVRGKVNSHPPIHLPASKGSGRLIKPGSVLGSKIYLIRCV